MVVVPKFDVFAIASPWDGEDYLSFEAGAVTHLLFLCFSLSLTLAESGLTWAGRARAVLLRAALSSSEPSDHYAAVCTITLQMGIRGHQMLL